MISRSLRKKWGEDLFFCIPFGYLTRGSNAFNTLHIWILEGIFCNQESPDQWPSVASVSSCSSGDLTAQSFSYVKVLPGCWEQLSICASSWIHGPHWSTWSQVNIGKSLMVVSCPRAPMASLYGKMQTKHFARFWCNLCNPPIQNQQLASNLVSSMSPYLFLVHHFLTQQT